MQEANYWYLAQGGAPDAEAGELNEMVGKHQKWSEAFGWVEMPPPSRDSTNVLSPPWWPEALKKKYGEVEAGESVEAPVLFSSYEQAANLQHELAVGAVEGYLKDREERGAADTDELYDTYLSHTVYGISPQMLAAKLEGCDFLCVEVDGKLRLRQDFINELG